MATGVRVKVEGATATVAAFKALGLKVRDLSDAFGRIGERIKGDAVPNTPVGATGLLRSSVRAGKAKTRATVSAGRAKVPYAGVINYGWPKRGISPVHFLNDALDKNRERAGQELHTEMERLIHRVGLD